MAKLFLNYLLLVFITAIVSLDLNTIKEEATKFTKIMLSGIENKLKKIEEEKKLVNTTTLEQIDRGVEFFQQSAQIHNLYGIKDSSFNSFLSYYLKKLKINQEFMDIVKDLLLQLSYEKNSDWKSFKFFYSRNDTVNTCNYACIIAQHDLEVQKINLIYTEIETSLNMTDIFVVSTTYIENGKEVQGQKIVNLPSEVKPEELNLVVDFFEVVAFKTFGSYFGIESNTEVNKKYDDGIKKLMFLK